MKKRLQLLKVPTDMAPITIVSMTATMVLGKPARLILEFETEDPEKDLGALRRAGFDFVDLPPCRGCNERIVSTVWLAGKEAP